MWLNFSVHMAAYVPTAVRVHVKTVKYTATKVEWAEKKLDIFGHSGTMFSSCGIQMITTTSRIRGYLGTR
jgi:hypothetical protein